MKEDTSNKQQQKFNMAIIISGKEDCKKYWKAWKWYFIMKEYQLSQKPKTILNMYALNKTASKDIKIDRSNYDCRFVYFSF